MMNRFGDGMTTMVAFFLFSFAASTSEIQAAKEPRRVWVHYDRNQRDSFWQSVGNLNQGITSKSTNQTTVEPALKVLYDFPGQDAVVMTAYSDQALLDLETSPTVMGISDDPKRYLMYLPDSIKRVGNLQHLRKQRNAQGGGLRGLQQQGDNDEIPYGVTMVQAPKAWEQGVTGEGVTVCVVDTGLDTSNPEYEVKKNLEGWDIGSGGGSRGWWLDSVGHGTHCSGTVAAGRGNAGVVGVAPDANIYTVRVFDDSGYVYGSALLDGARKCYQAGARVVSMSLGGPEYNSYEEEAFKELFDLGVISIAAAGNDGTSELNYPASYDGVISVGAVDSDKIVAVFSQRNSRVDVVAPGVDVLSTLPMSPSCLICAEEGVTELGMVSGTSMATPHVAGVAALLLSATPTASASQVRTAILSTAEDLGVAGDDRSYGRGLSLAVAAIEKLSSLVNGGDGGSNGGGDDDDASPPDASTPTPTSSPNFDDDNDVGGWGDDDNNMEDDDIGIPADDDNGNVGTDDGVGDDGAGDDGVGDDGTGDDGAVDDSTGDDGTGDDGAGDDGADDNGGWGGGTSPTGCQDGEILVTVRVKTDEFPEEMYWEVAGLLDSRPVLAPQNTLFSPYEYYEDSQCLPETCYEFTIVDTGGDGLCCSYGVGGYSVLVNGEEVGVGGSFGYWDSVQFGSCGFSSGASSWFSPFSSDSVRPTSAGAESKDTLRSSSGSDSSIEGAAGAIEEEECVGLQLLFKTDDSAKETSVRLYNAAATDEQLWVYPTGLFEPNHSYELEICVDPNQCFVLELGDTHGDSGAESFKLSYNQKVVAQGSRYGTSFHYMIGGNCI